MDTVIMYAAVAALFVLSWARDREKTLQALRKGLKSLEALLPQLIAVLVIISVGLALFDAEAITSYLGPSTGLAGVLAAAVLGSVTLIPGFVAFPLAGQLLSNGAGVLQIATFVSTLMMVGVVTLPVEMSYFGRRTAITRNLAALAFSFAAALFVSWVHAW